MSYKTKKTPGIWETVIFILIFAAIFGVLGHVMGGSNLLRTLMNTAHDLLLNTVFYLMAIMVIAGALSKLFSEFGVIDLLEKLLRPLMKPLYNLPGAASLGAVITFLSDNPTIMSLERDRNFSSYFKKYQQASLTNFGTAFGMGFIVVLTMLGYGQIKGALIGLAGALAGSVISTRMFQRLAVKAYPDLDSPAVEGDMSEEVTEEDEQEKKEKDSIFMRLLNSILDGGKSGVDLGFQIIPGVLVITTMVILLTFGPDKATGVYNGGAGQGVPILPWLADKIHWVFEWLFGFSDMRLIAFPMTALGAVGAAIGLLPTFDTAGILDGNAIAVCTAIGVCWSGFLSTHTAMLDAFGYRKLVSKAIVSHAIAGLCAGVIAHYLFVLVSLI